MPKTPEVPRLRKQDTPWSHENQNKFRSEILRRSTRSVVRRAQEMKDKANEKKGGRKRQRAAPEAGLGEPNAKVVQMSAAPQVAKDPAVPVPWRAPVARMY
jgi:hypothetical protein